MKIILNNIIPFGRKYAAINLFGLIFLKRGCRVTPILLNHEAIHSAQMKEMLWIPFYLVYTLEWLWLMIRFKGNVYQAYMQISFEREAYRNESDPDYLVKRKHFAQWR